MFDYSCHTYGYVYYLMLLWKWAKHMLMQKLIWVIFFFSVVPNPKMKQKPALILIIALHFVASCVFVAFEVVLNSKCTNDSIKIELRQSTFIKFRQTHVTSTYCTYIPCHLRTLQTFPAIARISMCVHNDFFLNASVIPSTVLIIFFLPLVKRKIVWLFIH